MCLRCLAASYRPKTDPTMSKKIEDRYVKAILPMFDTFEKKAVAAVESRARELAAPTVDLDLEWLRAYLEKTIDEIIITPSKEKQGDLVKVAYRQGVTWADGALKAALAGGTTGAGPIDWHAVAVLQSRNLSALKGITDEMSKQIVSALTEGLLMGDGVPMLTARIMDRCDKIGRTRAETMARTETMYAVNQGATIRYAQAGITKVKFLAGLDERACDECEGYHGEVFDIGDEPSLPIHPRCRCTYSPVVETPK